MIKMNIVEKAEDVPAGEHYVIMSFREIETHSSTLHAPIYMVFANKQDWEDEIKRRVNGATRDKDQWVPLICKKPQIEVKVV